MYDSRLPPASLEWQFVVARSPRASGKEDFEGWDPLLRFVDKDTLGSPYRLLHTNCQTGEQLALPPEDFAWVTPATTCNFSLVGKLAFPSRGSSTDRIPDLCFRIIREEKGSPNPYPVRGVVAEPMPANGTQRIFRPEELVILLPLRNTTPGYHPDLLTPDGQPASRLTRLLKLDTASIEAQRQTDHIESNLVGQKVVGRVLGAHSTSENCWMAQVMTVTHDPPSPAKSPPVDKVEVMVDGFDVRMPRFLDTLARITPAALHEGNLTSSLVVFQPESRHYNPEARSVRVVRDIRHPDENYPIRHLTVRCASGDLTFPAGDFSVVTPLASRDFPPYLSIIPRQGRSGPA